MTVAAGQETELDATKRFVIAIDGPAASGKSSTAQWVAERLGFRHVDSGALYRAATAARLRVLPGPGAQAGAAGVEAGRPTESPERPVPDARETSSTPGWTEEAVLEAASAVSLRASTTSFVPVLAGEEMGDEIRGSAVTRMVSTVAQMPGVREWVNDAVRRAARDYDVVVDGRDMGTAVFPDANLKIFLVADPWERAIRRLKQRLQRSPTEEEIAEETQLLVQRDAADATQTVQARDAVLIDTTTLTQEEQVDRIAALAQAVTHRKIETSGTERG
jgi:cytidylate kinase